MSKIILLFSQIQAKISNITELPPYEFKPFDAPVRVALDDGRIKDAVMLTYKGIEDNLEDVSSHLDEIRTDINTVETDIDSVESDITTIQTDITGISAALLTLNTRMTSAEGAITILQGQMTTVQGKVEQLELSSIQNLWTGRIYTAYSLAVTGANYFTKTFVMAPGISYQFSADGYIKTTAAGARSRFDVFIDSGIKPADLKSSLNTDSFQFETAAADLAKYRPLECRILFQSDTGGNLALTFGVNNIIAGVGNAFFGEWRFDRLPPFGLM